jgi:hypothetical protein
MAVFSNEFDAAEKRDHEMVANASAGKRSQLGRDIEVMDEV